MIRAENLFADGHGTLDQRLGLRQPAEVMVQSG
jgi:hypothetical protein